MRPSSPPTLPAGIDPGHELRTPLHAIRTAGELLLAGEGGELAAGALPLVTTIVEAARRLDWTVRLLAEATSSEPPQEEVTDLVLLLVENGFLLTGPVLPLTAMIRRRRFTTAAQVWHAMMRARQLTPLAEVGTTSVRLAGPADEPDLGPWILASQLMAADGTNSRLEAPCDCVITGNDRPTGN